MRSENPNIKTVSQKIGNIINMVNEIASQTNLMAINAAVDDDTPGEHDRGVVATACDIRNLAGKSAETANEIQKLINNGSDKEDISNKKVEKASKTLDEIITHVRSLTENISKVSSASQARISLLKQRNTTY